MRNHKVGSVSDAVAHAVEAFGQTHRKVAEFLGIRPSTLSYGMDVSEERPGGLGVAYLHRLAVHNPACAEPMAQHFAALAGGVYQPVEVHNVTNLYAHSSTIAKECGEANAALIKGAYSEGRGDLDEAEREITEAIEVLARAKAALQAKRRAA